MYFPYQIFNEIFQQIDIPHAIYTWHDDTPKYIKKMLQGVVLYTKPKNEHKKAFKKKSI